MIYYDRIYFAWSHSINALDYHHYYINLFKYFREITTKVEIMKKSVIYKKYC